MGYYVMKQFAKRSISLVTVAMLLIIMCFTNASAKTTATGYKKASDVVYKTYSARENYDYKGSAIYLAKKINAKYFRSENKIIEHIKAKISEGYGILFLNMCEVEKQQEVYLYKILMFHLKPI